MPRYTKPRASGWIEDDLYLDGLPPEKVQVSDHAAVDTGLVWATGEPIMRQPNPMGFGRDGEW